MNNIIITDTKLPEVNVCEVISYMGSPHYNQHLSDLVNECIDESKNALICKTIYCELDLSREKNTIDFGCFKVCSNDLASSIYDCEKAIVFASTIGIGIDRLIARYTKISPIKALCFQALGSERIEALCDAFCYNLSKEYFNLNLVLKPRFSPGYGDLKLDVQKEIVSVLDCSRRIGVSLTDSLIMTPTKSVTAIAGLQKKYN